MWAKLSGECTPDADGRVRALQRPGHDREVVDLVEAAAIAEALLGPRQADDLERLVEARAVLRRRERGSRGTGWGSSLGRRRTPAARRTGDRRWPPARRMLQRVVQRQQRDGGADADPPGALGDQRHHHERARQQREGAAEVQLGQLRHVESERFGRARSDRTSRRSARPACARPTPRPGRRDRIASRTSIRHTAPAVTAKPKEPPPCRESPRSPESPDVLCRSTTTWWTASSRCSAACVDPSACCCTARSWPSGASAGQVLPGRERGRGEAPLDRHPDRGAGARGRLRVGGPGRRGSSGRPCARR